MMNDWRVKDVDNQGGKRMSSKGIGASKSHLLGAGLIVIACGIALWMTLGFLTGSQSPHLQDDAAVEKATLWAGLSGPSFGGLTSTPSMVSGGIMTLNESVMFLEGQSISSESLEWEHKDDLVWVLVFDASVENNRADEGSAVQYTQMAVVMAAGTGELISRLINPAGHTADTSGLRDLTGHYAGE